MGRDGRGVKPISKSSIEISFVYKGERCRERIPLPPTTANLKRAEQHRARILFEISQGTFDYAQVFPTSIRAAKYAHHLGDIETVEQYLERWINGKKQHLAASTYRDYHSIAYNLLIPQFGKKYLSDIKRSNVRTWFDKIDADRDFPLSNKRFSNIQSCFRSALTDAVHDELIEVNPLYGWQYRRQEVPRIEDDIDPFTIEEQMAILAELPVQARNLFQFAFWTGLRTSELIALDWTDIDFSRGYVQVRKAMTRAARGKAEDTKTRASRREVKILPPALAALNAQKKNTFLLESNALFHNPGTDERWRGDHEIWRVWKSAVKRSEIRYRRPYQTRHTYASMMLSAGEHPMWVAQQMGHSDWTMIARRYGRWMPSADKEAGEKAIALFAKKMLSECCLSDQKLGQLSN